MTAAKQQPCQMRQSRRVAATQSFASPNEKQAAVVATVMRVRQRRSGWLLSAAVFCAFVGMPLPAHAGPKQGDVLQTNSLSMLLVNRDFTTHKTSSIKDTVNLSEVIGLHYYFVDRVRIGMGVQLTERLWPAPVDGASRLQRVALMPQVGWSFYDPFYTAVIFSYAPRTHGRAITDLAVVGALGAALPLARRVKLSVALEVPYAFHYHRTVGLVALTGISFRL
jgi:hypothetical protein